MATTGSMGLLLVEAPCGSLRPLATLAAGLGLDAVAVALEELARPQPDAWVRTRVDGSNLVAICVDARQAPSAALEVARRVRAQSAFGATPLVFVTGRDAAAFPLDAASAFGPIDLLADPELHGYADAKLAMLAERLRASRRREASARREAPDAASTNATAVDDAWFRALIDRAPQSVWLSRADGHITYCSPYWYGYTGLTPQQTAGDGWAQAIHPEHRERLLALWRQAVADGEGWQAELPLRRAGDGRYRWHLAQGVPLRDAAGRVQRWGSFAVDIHDAKEAEAERERLLSELRASNERLAEIVRQAPAFIGVLRGPDHVIERVNDRYLQLVGGRADIGKPLREARPELEAQGFLRLLDAVYRAGEPYTGSDVPVLLARQPGQPLEERRVDFVYLPLREADGRVSGILVHGVDLTERRRAEQALRDSEERVRLATEAAGLGVWTWDPVADRAVWENDRPFEIFGIEPSSEPLNLARFLAESIDPEDAERVGREKDRAVETHSRVHLVCRIHRRNDRAQRWIELTARPQTMRDGRVLLLGTVADVTEGKAAEAALRRSEELYRTVIESMDEGFCLVEVLFDAAGEPVDYRFLETNAAFVQHSGLDDAVGRTGRELVPGLEAHWWQAFGRVVRTGTPMRFVNEAHGLGRWFDVYATRLGGAGSRKVAVLFDDITGRRCAEQELHRLADELALADRRKNEFLATLAHELRNPLAPLRNGLHIMRIAADSRGAVESARVMMERQLGHMVHLVNDLLDVARISSGKLDLRPERVELQAVVGSAVETCLPQIEAGRHELSVDLPTGPVWLDADPIRLSQVLSNLLNNAARYTPDGGRIELSARLDGAAAVVLTVRDNGIGISADLLPSVFDMFAQGLSDCPRGGLGIGLALVRRLVEQHGGSVEAESAGPGQGSTFRLRLPLSPGPPVAARPQGMPGAAPPAQAEARLRVLVADDNADAAESLALVLQAEDHAVRTAHDGPEALRLAQSWRPDVAILDIGMPGLSGHEVAAALRRTPGLERITLLAMTGWGTEEDRARSANSGFDLHLTKPVDPLQVVRLLAQLAPRMAEAVEDA